MQISSEFTTLQIASFLHAEISCPCLLTFLVPRDLILTCAWHSQINSSVQYCFPSSVSTSVVHSTGWCYLLHIDLYLWKYRFAGRHHFFYKQMTYSATCAFLRSLLLTQTGMLLSSTHIQQIMWRTLIFPSILFLFKFSFLSLFPPLPFWRHGFENRLKHNISNVPIWFALKDLNCTIFPGFMWLNSRW